MVLKFQPVPAGQFPGACSSKDCEDAKKAELTVLREADAAHEGDLRRLPIPPPPFLLTSSFDRGASFGASSSTTYERERALACTPCENAGVCSLKPPLGYTADKT